MNTSFAAACIFLVQQHPQTYSVKEVMDELKEMITEDQLCFRNLVHAVSKWTSVIAELPAGAVVLVLSAGDVERGPSTITSRIVSRLPGVILIDMFGLVKHTNQGFAIYTKFLRDSLHVIGEDLQVPQLLRDRSDLRYFGCLESQKAFSCWGVSDLFLKILPYPTWWHIADNRREAYSALADIIDMTEEDFGILISKQRSDWSKDFWNAHPEKREEMSQRMQDFWDAHPEKREEMSQRMQDFWDAHPEKREEMSQRMQDFWDAHPEKREEMSRRMLALEALSAPGSCTALHANPIWASKFRDATSNRWRDDVDYRNHMKEILSQERPKLKATMLLKWQNPEFRTAMIGNVQKLLEARKEADQATAAELTLRFKDGSMTGVERVTILKMAKIRRTARIYQDSMTFTHAASDALATLIEDFYASRVGQHELDQKEAYSDPAQVETRRLAADKERTRRHEHQTQLGEIDKKRSAAVKKGWSTSKPDERVVRLSKATAAVNEKKLVADKECESLLLEFREGRMDARTRIKLVREYKSRAHARKKQGSSASTTPCNDKLAEEIISWWKEDPSRNKDDQHASRCHDAIQNAIILLGQVASGSISAEDRWNAHQKALHRDANRRSSGSTTDDPPAMKELARVLKEYYDANPLEAQKRKKTSADIVSKKRLIHENET